MSNSTGSCEYQFFCNHAPVHLYKLYKLASEIKAQMGFCLRTVKLLVHLKSCWSLGISRQSYQNFTKYSFLNAIFHSLILIVSLAKFQSIVTLQVSLKQLLNLKTWCSSIWN